MEQRTLTVTSYSGLANRLRVLTSAVVMAGETGRALTMHWHRLPTCGAAFDELFTNDLPVVNFADAPITPLPDFAGPLGRDLFDLLTATEPHIAIKAVTWLALPEIYPHHRPLLARCAAVLDELRPTPEIEERVAAFRSAHFRPRMIGVHLRRGDFYRYSAYSVDNTTSAVAATRRYLQACPDAGIFLCTDDGAADPVTGRRTVEGTHEKFRRAFGDRVIRAEPRSLDRADSAAVQDALVDLLLLRACDFVVGTWGSSFSELAVFGRDVPAVMCRSGGMWGWIDRAGTATGFWNWLNRQVSRHTGGRAGGIHLIRHMRPRAIAARLLQTYAPALFERVRSKKKF